MYYSYPITYVVYPGGYFAAYGPRQQALAGSPPDYSLLRRNRGYGYDYRNGYVSADERRARLQDQGPNPFVLDIDEATEDNQTFRTAIWTGEHLQVTLMSIPVGSDIGLEVHPKTDQFIRVEEGQGLVQMGKSPEQLDYTANVDDGYAIMVPAGTWHNVTNTGGKPLKVYSIYAPPEHPRGTVHLTKADAMASE